METKRKKLFAHQIETLNWNIYLTHSFFDLMQIQIRWIPHEIQAKFLIWTRVLMWFTFKLTSQLKKCNQKMEKQTDDVIIDMSSLLLARVMLISEWCWSNRIQHRWLIRILHWHWTGENHGIKRKCKCGMDFLANTMGHLCCQSFSFFQDFHWMW